MSITKLNCMELKDTRYSVYPYDGYNLEEILGKFYEAIKECNDLSFSLQEFNNWVISEGLAEEVEKQLTKIDWDNIVNSELYQTIVERLLNTNNRIEEVKNELSSQMEHIENSICVNNTNDAKKINELQILATDNNKPLLIKTGIYEIDETLNLTDNIIFEKNVVFIIKENIDGVIIQYEGKTLDFNGLKILVDVDNYNCVALTIKGFYYINESDLALQKNNYGEIKNVTVHNNKTIYPYDNSSGTGICVKIEDKQIFMWTKFQLYSSQFKNGFLFLSTAQSDTEAFVSSCDFDLVSWRNSNSIVFNDMYGSGWSDLRIKLKNQPAQNQMKVIKNINNSFRSSWVDVALWDLQLVSDDYINTLIDVDAESKNKFINSFDDGYRPINKYINYTGKSYYFPTRLNSVASQGNMVILNAWDYIYLFSKGIESTDSFNDARDKLLLNVNKLKHNGNIIIELCLPDNTSYSQELRSRLEPFIPRVPNDNYGFGKIKITLPCCKASFNSIFVEFTTASVTSLNVSSFMATRFSSQSGSDSLWTILGDLHGTTEQRNNIGSEIRLPQGFKFYDTTLNKPLFAVWGAWRDSEGNLVN